MKGMGMNKIVCDVCGKERKDTDNVKIEGRLRICRRRTFDKGDTVVISAENKDIFLCEKCSERLLKCADAMKEHKRIKIGRKNEI